MANTIDVKIPNIGDFDNVEVIEVLVSEGDSINVDDSLITVESDKASMEIPSPQAGKIISLKVNVGDNVSEGTLLLTLETTSGDTTPPEKTEASADNTSTVVKETTTLPESGNIPDTGNHTQVVVLGGGPGGYTAAFRAADLGLNVTLIEKHATLGGVCLNVGCIPSKALLHTAGTINEVKAMQSHGVTYGEPQIDLDKLREWKSSVVNKLTGGLAMMAKQRKVTVLQGTGHFTSSNTISIDTQSGTQTLSFDNAIIAAGSRVSQIPIFPFEDPRVMDSTDALQLAEIPKTMLVVGGGIIGLEMATVYDALGTKVSVVELTDGLIPGCDKDLVRPLQRRISKKYEAIYTGTKVTAVKALKSGIKVTFEGKKAPETATYDCILVATGRQPNGLSIGAENTGVNVDERGFIAVDNQQRTNISNIFAIGDIVGQPMLAHKAVHEGKVAAEVISGMKVAFEALTVPSVAYTDPEVAWMGLSETEAREKGIEYEKASFPWGASGRALGMGREEGMTKLLFDKESKQLLGAGMVGAHAGDLIAETVLALEMGADAEDIGLTIHPHPTLSESVAMCAEIAEGSITDLYIPKKKK